MRALARTGAWTVVGLVAGLLAATVAPLAFDARPYTVLSGSMSPAIAAGDLVVAKRIAPVEARIGDVVTFQDPDRPARSITHRIGGLRHDGRHVEVVTKGDANTAVEQWRISKRGDLGRVAYRIPWVGHATALTRTRIGFLLIVAAPLLLLAVNELVRIWRPERKGPHSEVA